MLASGGGTKQSERAVAGALNWLARHQLSDGSWSLSGYKSRCKDATCTGPGKTGDRPAAATALALLPFLGRRTDARVEGPYKKTIAAGVRFLLSNEKANGDLRIGGEHVRPGPGHHCAVRVLRNEQRQRAQAARAGRLELHHGGARPQGRRLALSAGQPGDLSVSGWQIMALKSGQMAYLAVTPAAWKTCETFLQGRRRSTATAAAGSPISPATGFATAS